MKKKKTFQTQTNFGELKSTLKNSCNEVRSHSAKVRAGTK